MKTFIIAEAGVNHNGSLKLAKQLVDVAVKAQADAVKFQTFKTENEISKIAQKAQYQKETTDSNESQYDMVKKLELPFEDFKILQNYCKQKGIMFLSTPFELESVKFLESLNLDYMKIPSSEITNLPFLREIASHGGKVILSTGMSTLKEVEEAINVLKGCEISLLHCTTEYPCPYQDVNLKVIQTMKERFKLPVGYSDHTQGIEIAIAAAATGAEIIEKHFTLDKDMPGPDHKASLSPEELTQMVKSIRNLEKAVGDGIKKPSPSEIKNMEIARKSIVAKCDIKKGEMFSEKNLTTKRPGSGISPMKWDEIIGQIAQKEYKEDDLI